MTDDVAEYLRPPTEHELKQRVALVRDAKRAKGCNAYLTVAELNDLLGPGVETILKALPGFRRSVALAKLANFGVIGVLYKSKDPRFRARINTPDKKQIYKDFHTVAEAVEQRNAWAEEHYPGCDEFKCDMAAALRRYKKRERKKRT